MLNKSPKVFFLIYLPPLYLHSGTEIMSESEMLRGLFSLLGVGAGIMVCGCSLIGLHLAVRPWLCGLLWWFRPMLSSHVLRSERPIP